MPDSLSDVELNRFLMLSSALGTYARALDSADSPQRPSAFEAASLATRDITKLHALDILHRTGYDSPQALAALMPSSGLTICRDEMESWSTFETDLFETAVQEHGKDFFTIRKDVLPWKTVKGIVEYYYFYKTTNRYLKHRQDKAIEAASKIKTIDVPSDNSQTNSLNNNCSVLIKSNGTRFRKPCKSCRTISSPHWYLIEKAQHCQGCYDYWKRYARFRRPIVSFDADSLSDASSLHDGDRSPSVKPFPCRVTKCSRTFLSEVKLMKHYAINHSNSVRVQRKIVTKPFQFFASVQTKIRRKRLRRAVVRRRPARAPFALMDYQAIERKYTSAMTADELKSLLRPNTKNRCSLVSVIKKLCASLYKNCIPEKIPDKGQPGSPPVAHNPKLTTNMDMPKPLDSRLPVPWIPRRPCQPIDFASYQYSLTWDHIQNAKTAVRKTRSTKWHFARDRVRSWMELKIVQREITYKRVSRNLYRAKDRRKSCITKKSQFSPVQFFHSNKRLKDSCRKYLKGDRFAKLARHPLKKAVARCDRCHESFAFLHMCG
ncbi:metastasis-associated protein [Nesidiocoris tenuis]|uniref:Metastasis-associated protein n=1 Tax=Nesidiocoris tenuis TaxID=355587 RepID=A0ABN7AXP8_9HEMI|nr:metastasis-associated protein [Nesidiocoris tenuis]